MATKNIHPIPLPGQKCPTPKRLIFFPSFDSILDFPSPGKPKKTTKAPDNGPQFCPSCGGGMDETDNYYTCIECGYQVRK